MKSAAADTTPATKPMTTAAARRCPRSIRRSGLVVLLALVATLVLAGSASAAVTSKVIAETAAPFAIATPNWVSEDGRYVVYEDEGLYLADTVTGISTFIAGAAESHPSISDDGRYVAYADATDGTSRAYVWDRTTGNAELVSLTSDEQPMSATPRGVTISGDGRYVAFLSQDPGIAAPRLGAGQRGLPARQDRRHHRAHQLHADPPRVGGRGSGPRALAERRRQRRRLAGRPPERPALLPGPRRRGLRRHGRHRRLGAGDRRPASPRGSGRPGGGDIWGVMLSGDGELGRLGRLRPEPQLRRRPTPGTASSSRTSRRGRTTSSRPGGAPRSRTTAATSPTPTARPTTTTTSSATTARRTARRRSTSTPTAPGLRPAASPASVATGATSASRPGAHPSSCSPRSETGSSGRPSTRRRRRRTPFGAGA